MAVANSRIEWTESTWSPVTGCEKVSPGCDNCYAEGIARRFAGSKAFPNGFGVTLRPERLDQPLRWKRPRRIFVNSMSDLFHDAVPDEYIVQVFARMWWSPRHTFQILTKRHGRMHSLLPRIEEHLRAMADDLTLVDAPTPLTWPLPNVHLGVSVENQKWADIRIPTLLDTPAAVRWISAEPLLGLVKLDPAWLAPPIACPRTAATLGGNSESTAAFAQLARAVARRLTSESTEPVPGFLDWCVAGGESGPGARPMHPDWARSLRDQCVQSGIPFYFKQNGEWIRRRDAETWEDPWTSPRVRWVAPDGSVHEHGAYAGEGRSQGWVQVQRVGKKAAGRELDGRTWDQFPA
ncbi:MAG TPA: phage Gp37/Gp68 family protein [Streptomyces sp.]|jgi:Bacteriophage protein gp37